MADRSDVLNQIEIQVLGALHSTSTVDERFVPFSALSNRTGLTRDFVRAACRSLTDMGFAEYQSGLWTDDGEVAGSGYAITAVGMRINRAGDIDVHVSENWPEDGRFDDVRPDIRSCAFDDDTAAMRAFYFAALDKAMTAISY